MLWNSLDRQIHNRFFFYLSRTASVTHRWVGGLFLPSEILEFINLIHPHMSETFYKDLALLTWYMEEEIKIYLGHNSKTP